MTFGDVDGIFTVTVSRVAGLGAFTANPVEGELLYNSYDSETRSASNMRYFGLCTAVLICTLVPTMSQTNRPQQQRTEAARKRDLEAQLVALERQSFEAIKNKDYTLLGSLMAEDAMVMDVSGLSNKAQALSNIRDLELTDF